MYRMDNLVEILLGTILILLVIGQPKAGKHYTSTTVGKLIFLAATIASGYHSLYAGLLVAAIYIILRNDYSLIEKMENKEDKKEDNDSRTDFVKKHCKDGALDSSADVSLIKYKNKKCNPCDDSCDFEITSAKEQLTVDEALRPKESNSIPV